MTIDVAFYRKSYEVFAGKKGHEAGNIFSAEKSDEEIEKDRYILSVKSIIALYEDCPFPTCKKFAGLLGKIISSRRAYNELVNNRGQTSEWAIDKLWLSIENDAKALGLTLNQTKITDDLLQQSFATEREKINSVLSAYFTQTSILNSSIGNFASLCFVLIEIYDLSNMEEKLYQDILRQARLPKDEQNYLRSHSNSQRSNLKWFNTLKKAVSAFINLYQSNQYKEISVSDELVLLQELNKLNPENLSRDQMQGFANSFLTSYESKRRRDYSQIDETHKTQIDEISLFSNAPEFGNNVRELRNLVSVIKIASKEEKQVAAPASTPSLTTVSFICQASAARNEEEKIQANPLTESRKLGM